MKTKKLVLLILCTSCFFLAGCPPPWIDYGCPIPETFNFYSEEKNNNDQITVLLDGASELRIRFQGEQLLGYFTQTIYDFNFNIYMEITTIDRSIELNLEQIDVKINGEILPIVEHRKSIDSIKNEHIIHLYWHFSSALDKSGLLVDDKDKDKYNDVPIEINFRKVIPSFSKDVLPEKIVTYLRIWGQPNP